MKRVGRICNNIHLSGEGEEGECRLVNVGEVLGGGTLGTRGHSGCEENEGGKRRLLFRRGTDMSMGRDKRWRDGTWAKPRGG